MARKRKKSRSKKQRNAKRRSDAEATEAPEVEGAPLEPGAEVGDTSEEDVVFLDDDAAPEATSLDGDDEPAIISLDDDEEEEEQDPERLIAETLALAIAEEVGSDPATGADAARVERTDSEGEEEDSNDSPEDAASDSGLSITYDAVAALTEMQAEGLIDLPNDLVIDLGEATTDEQRDRLLSAALAHVEMQEARYRVPTGSGQGRRWVGTAASALVTLALLVAVAPPGILVPEPPTQLTESDRSYGVLVALLLQAQQIDAFRAREQRLPDNLDEVGAVLHDIRFVKSSNRLYQLVAYTTDGIAVVYDSAAPAAIFQTVAERWITTREDL